MRLVLLLLLPCTVFGQPTFLGGDIISHPVGYVRPIGTTQNKSGGSSASINAIVRPGETIIMTIAHDSNAVLTQAVWNGSEIFTLDVTNRVGTTAGNVSCAIISLIPTQVPDVSATMTASFNASVGAISATAYAVKGQLVLDKFSTNSGTGTSPTSNASALGTTANQCLIAVVALEGPNTDAVGVWSSAIINGQKDGTSGGGDASNCSITDGYLLISSPGRSNLGSKTGMANRDWAAGVALYKFR